MATPFARVVYHYPAFIDAIRDRTADLEISRLEIDRIAGLPVGYSGKLYAQSGKACRVSFPRPTPGNAGADHHDR